MFYEIKSKRESGELFFIIDDEGGLFVFPLNEKWESSEGIVVRKA